MRLELDVFGDQQLSRELLRFRDAARDMRPAFDSIHEYFLNTETRQFGSQGRSSSGGWAALRPGTIAAKQRAGLDPRILHATLRLRQSLTQRTHPDHIFETTADSMFVGTRVDYARFHQTGTSRMPRRRPVELTETQRRNWVKTLQRWLVHGGT